MEADNIVPFEQAAPPARDNSIPMKSDLVEQASQVVPDPLVLVNIVSKRVEQLNRGKKPLVEHLPSTGFANIALQEIIEGKIKIRPVED